MQYFFILQSGVHKAKLEKRTFSSHVQFQKDAEDWAINLIEASTTTNASYSVYLD